MQMMLLYRYVIWFNYYSNEKELCLNSVVKNQGYIKSA